MHRRLRRLLPHLAASILLASLAACGAESVSKEKATDTNEPLPTETVQATDTE